MVQKILSEEYVKEIRMATLHLLFEKSKAVLLSTQEAPIIRYQKRIKARKIVYDGYVSLPSIYQEVFLDPLKNLLLTQDYTTILHAMDSGAHKIASALSNRSCQLYLMADFYKVAYKYSDIQQENTLKNIFTSSFSQIQTPLVHGHIAQIKLVILYISLFPDRISCILFGAEKFR